MGCTCAQYSQTADARSREILFLSQKTVYGEKRVVTQGKREGKTFSRTNRVRDRLYYYDALRRGVTMNTSTVTIGHIREWSASPPTHSPCYSVIFFSPTATAADTVVRVVLAHSDAPTVRRQRYHRYLSRNNTSVSRSFEETLANDNVSNVYGRR